MQNEILPDFLRRIYPGKQSIKICQICNMFSTILGNLWQAITQITYNLR